MNQESMVCSACGADLPREDRGATCSNCGGTARTYQRSFGGTLEPRGEVSKTVMRAFGGGVEPRAEVTRTAYRAVEGSLPSPRGELNVVVREFHETFLDSARDYIRSGDFAAAMIFTQTAVELFFERRFDEILQRKGAAWLVDTGLLGRNRDIGSDRLRKAYAILTGDEIAKTQKTLWQSFREHQELRNDVVHKGHKPTRVQAETFVDLVERVMVHVGTVVRGL